MSTARRALPPAMLVATLCFHAAVARAQDWQVDLGGTSVRYDSATALKSGSLSPQVEWNTPWLLVELNGSVAAQESSAWSGQGQGDFSTILGRARRLRGWGPAGLLSVEGSVHSSGYRTSSTRGEARAQFNQARAGLWLGLAGGTGWNSSGGGIVGHWGPTAGFWTRPGQWTTTATLAPFHLEGFWFPEVTGQVSRTARRLELTGYAGWRGASSASGLGSGAWAGGSATAWLTGGLALVVAGGSYAADLPQGLPGGRYLSLALRLAGGRHRPQISGAVRQTIIIAERGQGGLRFIVPGAQRVDLVADWTSWQAVPMTRAGGGGWTLPLDLGSGVYRFNLIVDGERWIVPAGYASVDDGFGGKTALLVVP